jgi:hypothetical protein
MKMKRRQMLPSVSEDKAALEKTNKPGLIPAFFYPSRKK